MAQEKGRAPGAGLIKQIRTKMFVKLGILSAISFALHFNVIGFGLLMLALVMNNANVSITGYKTRFALHEMSIMRYFGNKYPLEGKTAIVTGSNTGLGMQVAEDLLGMGATVVMAVRTVSKGNDAADVLRKAHPGSPGKVVVMALDVSDFDSVRSFSKEFSSKFDKLHFLVNNAGIHYASVPGNGLLNVSLDQISKQNYDLSFASNYMGHWLLSKLLLPVLTSTGKTEKIPTRLVNISSAYHLSVNGDMLRVGQSNGKNGNDPAASSVNNHQFSHRRRAYGNSKLAQILHTNELDRRLKAQGNYNVECVSVCPGWVGGTSIVPTDMVGNAVHKFGFDIKAASLAPIGACIFPQLKGGEHVTNYSPVWTKLPLDALPQGVRDVFSDLMAGFLLFFESLSFGFHVSRTSKEAYDEVLAKELYDWTEDAVERKGSSK